MLEFLAAKLIVGFLVNLGTPSRRFRIGLEPYPWKAMSEHNKEQEFMAKKVKEAYESDSNPESSGASGAEKPHSQHESGEKEASVEDLNSLLSELERLGTALDEEKQKSADMQTRYLRAVADLENYRKRSIKEKEELGKTAVANFVEELLPVLDNFKLGMKAAEAHPDAKVVADGFRMVLEQFFEVFKARGIEEIVPNGQEFDPQFEECVSHLPHDEVPENHVIETIRAGYRIKERLIRAATVVVSSGPADSTS